MTHSQWKEEYRALLAYGRERGWVRFRDPLSDPTPPELRQKFPSEMRKQMQEREMAQTRPRTPPKSSEEKIKDLMGYNE